MPSKKTQNYGFPEPAFHFRVVMSEEGSPKRKREILCQSVSGLAMHVVFDEGGACKGSSSSASGSSLFTKGINYTPLVIQRAMLPLEAGFDIQLFEFIKKRAYNPSKKKMNLLISLLDAVGQPIRNWRIMNAVVSKWSMGEFNAEKSALMIQKLEFKYEDLFYEK